MQKIKMEEMLLDLTYEMNCDGIFLILFIILISFFFSCMWKIKNCSNLCNYANIMWALYVQKVWRNKCKTCNEFGNDAMKINVFSTQNKNEGWPYN
jgi:hypothetical protein